MPHRAALAVRSVFTMVEGSAMVKRKKNHEAKSKSRHGSSRKKRKEGRYWIEDCRETLSSKAGDFTLWITRADLHDDHQSGQMKRSASAAPSIEPVSIAKSSVPTVHTNEKRTGTLKNRAATVPPPDRDPFICVKRAESSKLPLKSFKGSSTCVQLPDGDCGDGVVNPYPKSQVADKYWAQRKRLFSRFDDGIKLDQEGWFSVTPEAIADHIAERMVTDCQGLIMLDAFVGVGGNAIAFARRTEVSRVICVDIDDTRLRLAANNCRVYDVPDDKVVFVLADACNVLSYYQEARLSTKSEPTSEIQKVYGYSYGGIELLPDQVDAIFLSPPWGGSDYEKVGCRNYDLSCIKLSAEVDGDDLLQQSVRALPHSRSNIAYFLPRNANGISVGRSAYRAGLRESIFEQNVLNDKLKTITMYTKMHSIN